MLLGMFSPRAGAAQMGVQLFPPTALSQALTMGNRRATATETRIGGAKTIYGRRAGKMYFEAVLNNKIVSPQNMALIGVQRTDSSYEMSATYAYACGIYVAGTAGSIWSNGTSFASLGNPENGTVYHFAYDLDLKLFWVRVAGGSWNANPTANPATGSGGLSMSDLAPYDVTPVVTSDFIGEQVTFNFSASDLTSPPPAGFIPWPTDTTGDNSGLGFTSLNSLRRAGMTLSGGDLVATRNLAPAIARSPDYRSEGRFYMEFTATLLNANGDSCGVAAFQATTANLVSNGSNSAIVYRSGNIWSDSAQRGAIGVIANGDRVDVAVDMDARLIWFRKNGGDWNGVLGNDPAAGVGGIAFAYDVISPAVSLGGTGGANGSSWSANFGSTPFAGTAPEGFIPGWARRRAPIVQYLWTGAVL